jgi:exopolysaccharide biosynthesis polyprenyl glycosylphosphotransferase
VTATQAAPASAAEAPPGRVHRPATWQRRYTRLLVVADLAALAVAALCAYVLRFGGAGVEVGGISYALVAAGFVAGWMTVLGLSRCYEERFVGTGPEEFRRVGNASIRVTAGTALVAFAFQAPLSRVFVGVFLLLGTVLLLAGRATGRRYLHRARRQGRFTHRVLLVGAERQLVELAAELCRDPNAGLVVVGACVPGRSRSHLQMGDGRTVPVLGSISSVPQTLRDVGADTVAVAASPGITGEALRRLSYELEGSGVDLLVAPALTNITGTRVSIRPVAGLPLLHLDEPELSGARKVLKLAFDVGVAAGLVFVLAPLLLALAVLVRVNSQGPALFSQERVGLRGRPFQVYKFRSMHVDAEQRLAELSHLNEHDGVLFKVRNDPRITSAGRWLRKYSLDELPQLFNVLKGDMSLVGPRPPLASEVARYEGHAHRRLLVKPGITGLWQVSGRSDLSWDDTVRLDLQYVENWSLALDVSILLRTASAVFAGKGAY